MADARCGGSMGEGGRDADKQKKRASQPDCHDT